MTDHCVRVTGLRIFAGVPSIRFVHACTLIGAEALNLGLQIVSETALDGSSAQTPKSHQRMMAFMA